MRTKFQSTAVWTATLALVAGSTFGGLARGAHADAAATYEPASYQAGPIGPDPATDRWNVISTDPATGRITVARAYPVPGTFSCGGFGPYANWTVTHLVGGPVAKVSVDYTQALLDNFTFLRVTLDDVDATGRAEPIGFVELRGPFTNPAGTATLDAATNAFWQQPVAGHMLRVTFGLNESSACLPAQSADAGTATFARVTIT